MMDKIFAEHDWESTDVSEHTNYTFAKEKIKPVKSKRKRDKLSKENNLVAGRYVRAPPSDNGNPVEKPINKSKPKKRKFDDSSNKDDAISNEPKSKSSKPVQNLKLNGKQKQKSSSITAATSDFREKLVDSLKGSRFRFINEQLYKTTGTEAQRLFQEDPSAFQAYHEGYRHQISRWTVNPLDRIIKSLSKLPADYVVADFGCGEARLAESVEQKVYSLDLVAANSSVIACDMANTPLEMNSINVVVFCLSLMGTNLRDFLLEANRVLKVGGLLKIAEVSSRFDNVKEFIDCVHKCGFLLDNKDLKHKLFYFFNFKKVRSIDKSAFNGKHFSLKPCLYKKR